MLINSKVAKQQLLNILAGQSQTDLVPADMLPYLTGWLVKAKLGAALYEALGDDFIAEKATLQGIYYTNVYRDTVQKKLFLQVAEQLNPAETEIILLKGSAIAPLAWDEPFLRFKADVDFLVRREKMADVHKVLHGMQFRYKKPDKIKSYFSDLPPTNKEGQIEMVSPTVDRVQIEAHTEIFVGHVQRLTNRRIEDEIWERKVPADLNIMPAGVEVELPFWRLGNEDLILHTIIHTAVNHQYDPNTLRNMVDVLRLNDRLEIDWQVVYERVVWMRAKTAVWLFLHLMAGVFGELPSEIDALRQKLEPGKLRRHLLEKFITPDKVLNLYNILLTSRRFGLLLLQIDRPIDMLKVLVRLPWLMAD